MPPHQTVSSHTATINRPLCIICRRDKYSDSPAGYIHWENVENFKSDLNSWHSRELKNKGDNILISPAIFDPNHPNGEANKRRGIKNIAYLRHIWLDFENGELKPNEIGSLFPHNRLFIFNTFNHTPNKPRFRVIFLTAEVLTPSAYEMLWREIAEKLKDAGYSVGKDKPHLRPSGLDVSKRTPTSLFYAPCQAKDSGNSFFIDCNGPERQLLDGTVWIANNVVQFPMPLMVKDSYNNVQRTVDQAKVEKATEKWRQSINYPGEGNPRFFKYALDLRVAGMSLPAIEALLRSEAQFGRSHNERRAQIPSIMSSLKQSGRKVA